MKVVAITGERKAEVVEIDKPVLGKNQILMKVNGCALCTWEQRMYSGAINYIPFPFVGGHEIAGEIAALGEGVDAKVYPVGKKIVANLIKKPCGKCYFCRHGAENLCTMADDIDRANEIADQILARSIAAARPLASTRPPWKPVARSSR